MSNKIKQASDNNQLWREVSIAYRYFIKPTRKEMHLQYKKSMYPFLFKGRYLEDLEN